MSTKQKAEHVQTKPTTFVRLNLDAGGAESASNGWILLFSLAAWCWVIPTYREPGKLGYEWMMGGPVQSKYEPNRKPLHSSVPIYWSPILLDLGTDTCWNTFNLTMETLKCELVQSQWQWWMVVDKKTSKSSPSNCARTAATLPQTCSSQMRSVICRHRVENTWEILGISYKTIISGCWFQQSIRNYEHHWSSLRIIIQSDWNMLLNSCRTYHL